MSEIVRSATILPAQRTGFTVGTADGIDLIGEIARPIGPSNGAILSLHPLPTEI